MGYGILLMLPIIFIALVSKIHFYSQKVGKFMSMWDTQRKAISWRILSPQFSSDPATCQRCQKPPESQKVPRSNLGYQKRCWRKFRFRKNSSKCDGRNPTPVDMVNIPLFTGIQRWQVNVCDFWTINSIQMMDHAYIVLVPNGCMFALGNGSQIMGGT